MVSGMLSLSTFLINQLNSILKPFEFILSSSSFSIFHPSQNRRAKWRKREPPRKTGYINTNNSPSTQITGQTIHTSPAFATFQQPTTVTPPSGSVDSWNSYQSYDISSHYNIISPASSPYATYSHQYTTATYDNPLYVPVRSYEYDSPSRIQNGSILVDTGDVHHKSDYTTIDESVNDG